MQCKNPFALIQPNSQGILCLVAALVMLTLSDSIIKWLSPQLALHEIVLLRSVFALLVIFVIVHLEGGITTLKTRRPALHLLRGSMLVLANMFFFLGLASMPFAEAVALFYTAPLFICLLAKPVLGEQVGLARWLAILLGLAGVGIMLRPGSEVFRLVSLLPVLAALSYAAMTMMTRRLGMQERAGAMAFYIQIAFILVSSLVGLGIGDGSYNQYDNETLAFLLRAWRWPDSEEFLLLVACGFIVGLGGYLLSQAYRLAQASIVAPFEYSSLPFALMVGYYFWGDWPDWIAFAGSGLIIGSGLIVVLLEQRKQYRQKPVATRLG